MYVQVEILAARSEDTKPWHPPERHRTGANPYSTPEVTENSDGSIPANFSEQWREFSHSVNWEDLQWSNLNFKKSLQQGDVDDDVDDDVDADDDELEEDPTATHQFLTATLIPLPPGNESFFEAVARMVYHDRKFSPLVRHEITRWISDHLLPDSALYASLPPGQRRAVYETWTRRVSEDLRRNSWDSSVPVVPTAPAAIGRYTAELRGDLERFPGVMTLETLKRRPELPERVRRGQEVHWPDGGVSADLWRISGPPGTFLEVVVACYAYGVDTHVFFGSVADGNVTSVFPVSNRRRREIGLAYKSEGNWDAVIPNLDFTLGHPDLPRMHFYKPGEDPKTHVIVDEKDFESTDSMERGDSKILDVYPNGTFPCPHCNQTLRSSEDQWNPGEKLQGFRWRQCMRCGLWFQESEKKTLGGAEQEYDEAMDSLYGTKRVTRARRAAFDDGAPKHSTPT